MSTCAIPGCGAEGAITLVGIELPDTPAPFLCEKHGAMIEDLLLSMVEEACTDCVDAVRFE